MTDLDERLRAYYDAADEPPPEALARIRRRVLTPQRRSPAPWRWPTLVSAAVAFAVLALVVLTRSASVPADDARATLELVAARAAGSAPTALPGDGFVYARTRQLAVNSVFGKDGEARYESESLIETWAPADTLRAVRIDTTTGLHARPLTADDAARLSAYGSTYQTVQQRSTTTPNRAELPVRAYLAAIPTDPHQVVARLREEVETAYGPPPRGSAKPSVDQRTFTRIGDLLSEAGVLLEPAQRAALFRAAALLPGVRELTERADLAGRSGVAIGYGMPNGTREELIVDVDSGQVLGLRTVDISSGTVLAWSSSEQRVVRAVGGKESAR
ncbi:CU044_5270 family protein [Tenggerimyces flavus]|uniref:CU044_5270 family protein n=1 Tax=Tenggerimyces flavus TaxID=1708749 RepID=A0ABV7YET2_9ACTN|nr:CU044_5270 family protein [Tenggerimyces flavus]MBM7787049.1 hypothetical protein [Tenggerimyces flavus]